MDPGGVCYLSTTYVKVNLLGLFICASFSHWVWLLWGEAPYHTFSWITHPGEDSCCVVRQPFREAHLVRGCGSTSVSLEVMLQIPHIVESSDETAAPVNSLIQPHE